ncbi:MAG: DsbC family protein [Gammaproteobacteria bacterium]|nr:DsbC family protein [Gammaproteobacteria bacterium]
MMIRKIVTACLLVPALAISNGVLAEPGKHDAIEKSLKKVLPNVTIDRITPSPVDGVSEVLMGPSVFYITNDGKYLFQGNLIDMKTRKDLSEVRRKEVRISAIDDFGEDRMIIFPAKETRHTITVFTDIDCGYCRKLHNEIDQYNAKGITVRYLMYPRSGPNSRSFDKAVAVWCEEDRKQALTDAKAGKELPKADCDNPVKEEYELGGLIGIRGTPAIILEDGEMLPGYIPAERLSKSLETRS